MKKLEQEIINWQNKTFPNANIKAYEKKFDEEREELDIAIKTGTNEEQHEELADVVITGIGLLKKRGVLLSDVIEKKMKVVKNREYGEEDKDGGRSKI